ncbi:MarR family winged helix-turn-helix transcriptional regulator [Tepidibacter formicigenes]|uniref:Transcriptional regulator, MarR family n=1 Tax=Tepidibacter formicigenes DSM 15518 TaxID=1123349 RepID=A0A1M6RQ44_9FIRM|nr:MarR family transcriptional regulator [Tepidibacter formicigenes]SHK34612.1 transcriptional regulator, MarR family [Tepidibacter formicigenes DSM 15518]
MSENIKILNELLVDIFYDITNVEKKMFSHGKFKDLSITEVRTINAIGINKPKKMSEVAIDLNITVGTLTTSINRLVKKGYVKRIKVEDDRRIVQIQLTDKGKSVYNTHKDFHYEIIKNMISGLNKNEQDILIESLKNVSNFFKENNR